MFKKQELLKLMISQKKDENGVPFYDVKEHGFYDFIKDLKLEKKEYEDLIKLLSNEKCIIIDMNGSDTFEQAKIIATQSALNYL